MPVSKPLPEVTAFRRTPLIASNTSTSAPPAGTTPSAKKTLPVSRPLLGNERANAAALSLTVTGRDAPRPVPGSLALAV